MEDRQIVDLYWARAESAITETDKKYGGYCYTIAHNILHSREDSEECVSDTYWRAWNAMPEQRPDRLAAFLGKITRHLSLNRWEYCHAEKRGGGQVPLALEELHECLPSDNGAERMTDDMVVAEVLNRFLSGLSREKRVLFLRRYWYLSSISEIAADCAMSESKVKMSLMRSRKALRQMLEKEGIRL